MVAVAKNGVIGHKGDMPWHLSSDLKMFRKLTMGKPIIMGRRTWNSLKKKPLDGRDNIVVTRDRSFTAPGAIPVHSIDDALTQGTELAHRSGANEVVIIGGAEIYMSTLSRAQRIYWTEVNAEPEGDTYFPDFDWAKWHQVHTEPIKSAQKDEFTATFHILERSP